MKPSLCPYLILSRKDGLSGIGGILCVLWGVFSRLGEPLRLGEGHHGPEMDLLTLLA